MMPRPDAEGRGAPSSAVLTGRQWRLVQQSLGLSPRELEVAQGVFDDDKEAAIAMKLGVSPHTVHTHFERLYQKLGVRSRAQLVVKILQVLIHSHSLAPGEGGGVRAAEPAREGSAR